MAIPVNVFNANQFPLTIIVNRGTQVSVAAVNTTTWVAGTTAAGTGPGFDNGGASPNNLGPGANNVQVQLGTSTFHNVSMQLPDLNPFSVQVYIFFPQAAGMSSPPSDVGSVAWFVLYQGMVVAHGESS